MTLRSIIGLTIGIIIILLTIIRGTLIGTQAERLLLQEVGSSLASIAESMSDKINGDMQARAHMAQVLSRLDQLLVADAAQRIVDEIDTRDPALAWAGVTDAQGQVMAGSGGVLVGKSLAERPVFRQGINGLFLGDVHEAVLLAKLLPNPTGEPMQFVDVSVPIRAADGTVGGVLALHYSWDWARQVVANLLAPLRTRGGLEVVVVAANGTILLGPDPLVGQKLALPSLSQARAGQTGWAVEDWPDGQQHLTGFSSGTTEQILTGLGWAVLVRQPVDIAYAPATEMRNGILISGILLASLFGGLGWLAAHRIARPLHAIAKAADKISHGVPGASIPMVSGPRELRALSKILRELVVNLTASNKALVATNEALTRMETIAYQDRLTTLPNRRFFEQYLDVALSRARTIGGHVVVLYLDLDGFKPVNDHWGHDAGDEVLRQTGIRLASSVRQEDVIARIGGDEFAAVLVLSPDDGTKVMELPRRLLTAINEPIRIREQTTRVGCSIGVAQWPDDGDDLGQVMKRADEALYRAKRLGKNRIVFYANQPPDLTQASA